MYQALYIIIPAGLALLLFYIIKRIKQARREKELVFQQNGFYPVENLDPGLKDRIISVSKRSKEKLRIKDIYQRSSGYYDLYSMEIYTPNSDGDNNRIVMVCHGLDLPRFAMIPQINIGGFLGSALNKVIQALLNKKGFKKVEFPGRPDIAEKFTLITEDENALRSKLPEHVWSSFATGNRMQSISGGKDIIVFHTLIDQNSIQKKPLKDRWDEALKKAIEQSDKIWGLLEPVRKSENSTGARMS